MTEPAAAPLSAGVERSRAPLVALLGANAVSLLGNRVTALAIPWFVLETTGSAARTGLVAFAGLLPTVIALLLGGALVDRLGFKRTSILADLASGVTVAAIPLLHATVGLAFWHLLVLTFLGALLDAPGGTARESLLPDLAEGSAVPLERANGASGSIQALTGLVGPPLAGLLIVAFGPSNVLWLDAASFAVSAALVAVAVPSPPPPEATERTGYAREVREGLRFLWSDRLVLGIAVLGAVVNFLAAPLFGVVLPVYARDAYGTARDLGLLLAGVGVGSLVGSVLVGAVGPRLPRRPTLAASFVVGGVALLPLAGALPLAAAIAALAVVGVGAGTINPIGGTVLQERIPAELRGRVLGAFMAGALVAAPLGVLIAGAVIEAVGVRPLLVATAAVFLAAALAIAVHPAFRELDHRSGAGGGGERSSGGSVAPDVSADGEPAPR